MPNTCRKEKKVVEKILDVRIIAFVKHFCECIVKMIEMYFVVNFNRKYLTVKTVTYVTCYTQTCCFLVTNNFYITFELIKRLQLINK